MGSTLGMQPNSMQSRPIMKVDILSRILGDMCRPGLLERGEDTTLKEFVEAESRTYKGERFNRFTLEVYHRVKALIQSHEPHEKLAGVVAVDELGETKSFGESTSRLSDLIRLLMDAFGPYTDIRTMQMASETLGRLVAQGGVGVSDVVDEQVQHGIQWLAGPRQEYSRLAGVMVLQELAIAAPAVFNVHVRAFIEVIWNPLRDPKQNIREAAVSALRASLVLVEKRETRYRVQWYYRLFEETQRGLTKVTSIENVHGSLLVMGELLSHTGEFMLARYREVCDTVLRFKDSKEKLIRRAVIALIPKLAAFAPERFVRSYLKQSIEHLISMLSSSSDKGSGFAAIAELTNCLAEAGVASHMKTPDDFLKPIADQIEECLSSKTRGKGQCNEALECAGVLCVALKEEWEPYMADLLEPAMTTGLCPALVGALHRAVESLPTLLPKVQALLLDLLSLALTRRPFFATATISTVQILQTALMQGEVQGIALTRLALQTLASFPLVPHHLLEFMKDFVMPYLEDSEPLIRKDAALAICQVVERHAEYSTRTKTFTMAEKRAIDAIIHRLLAVAVIDPATNVRRMVFESLANSSSLDFHIAQPESLKPLFIAFNDESPIVRSLAIKLAGHLLSINPAYVGPALRRHLLQLINDMDSSPDSQQREESAKLLCVLIRNAPRLVHPYTSAILKALLTKLRIVSSVSGTLSSGVPKGIKLMSQASEPAASNSSSGMTLTEEGLHVAVLDTLGELSSVAGVSMQAEVPSILPLIIDALADATSSQTKRIVATRTLGRIVESTGTVVTPYLDYPQLLGILLRMLDEGSAAARREVVRTLGILGALDPHEHKMNLAELQGEGKLEREGVRPQYPGRELAPPDPVGGLTVIDSVGFQDLLPSTGLATSSEDYYPTVAINALMRILRDPSLASLHGRTVAALFRIVRSMGLGFVPYLPKVVPVLLSITRRADDINRKVEMIRALGELVVLMRQHIRKYLPDMLNLVDYFWEESSLLTPHVLFLLSELAATLRDDFRGHVTDLLPKFVDLLDDAERTGEFSLVSPALGALCSLGPVLEDSLPLILPSIFALLGAKGGSEAPISVKEDILSTLEMLLPTMQLASHSAAILHPLIRVMNGPHEDLRVKTLDVICSIALAIGPDFEVFIPIIQKTMARNKMAHHPVFSQIATRLTSGGPPCISDAVDWERSSSFLASEHLGKRKMFTPEKVAMEQALAGISLAGSDEDEHKAGVHSEQGLFALRRAWESSQRSTREDWAEWMRNFSIELLKQSPSRALRACSSLAQANPGMARELFAAGFVSCWSELDENMQEQLVRSLEAALASPTIPPDIVTTLLNLAEFMEHDEKALPLDTRTLGALAEKCHAYAKALHYKELEFQTTPHSAVEALISINNQLRQPDAAVGVLDLAQNQLSMALKESWYEKLQRWDDALKAYQRKVETCKPGSQAHAEALLGQCRCLAALAEWETLFHVCKSEWTRVEPPARKSLAPVAAHAAWQLGDWEQMRRYVNTMTGSHGGGAEGAFLSAVLDVHNGSLEAAAEATERARELLGADLSALVGESYERAYADMVRVQQLTELEEIVIVKAAERVPKVPSEFARQVREHTQSIWKGRLRGVQRNVEVWQEILSVRRLLIGMHEDVSTWLKFSGLCRGVGRMKQSRAILENLLTCVRQDCKERQLPYLSPINREMDVLYVWCKHMWSEGQRQEAFGHLQKLITDVEESKSFLIATGESTEEAEERMLLYAKAHLKTGVWRRQLSDNISEGLIASIMSSMRLATDAAPQWAKAWHQWAYFNVESMVYYNASGQSDMGRAYVAPAVTGFFKAIELSQEGDKEHWSETRGLGSNLQDILRLLTLWFAHGDAEDVEAALREGFGMVSIDTWLAVIPQIIARIHTNSITVRDLIQSLLIRVGRHHPQALMYPLLVACKSQSPARRAAATAVVEAVRQHSATLVEQAQLVGGELIRMAILWHEMWHEALEEASRLYFGESNVDGMLNTLLPLHEMMRKQGPTTLKEIAFTQAYGRELDEAHEWCLKYKSSRKEAELHQAWDLYYHVFKRINKQLPSLTTLELQYVAPALVKAQNLELAVPGTYIAGEPLVTISSFAPQLTVITSKQRPRKLSIFGSDGAEYVFLLKGHEDLRQDERVMQLFGLVNSMLANDRDTAERELSIARYAVIPLSPNSGLIGWVPNTDTLHALIREYRDARKIPLNVEHRLMLGMAPDFDHLTIIQKVEVFEHALDSTSGEDLNRVLWLKSRSSEMWLDKRTNYTRSTAVMSMVGYILGLGDRHPSNLMLDRYSGKLLHIDFGDCFEASMHREKFPERIPFRLTRMMVKAMEVAGIEGNFRATCDEVMRVLRSNKDSVMAMLEAFVHDPLINWRLLNADNVGDHPDENGEITDEIPEGAAASVPRREITKAQVLAAYGIQGDPSEALNDRAVAVMKRISDKLTGRDFLPEGYSGESDTVKKQVRRLIQQATSHENLCQSYIGWCPWW